ARPERVPELPQVHELRHLALPHDQLRAALDRFVVIRKTKRKGVPRIIHPFDDFDRLRFLKVEYSHKRVFHMQTTALAPGWNYKMTPALESRPPPLRQLLDINILVPRLARRSAMN